MARIEMQCKVTYTKWFYAARLLRWLRMTAPKWMHGKTIAWMVVGDKVRQIKLGEAM